MKLSARQYEILELVKLGLNNQEIGDELKLSNRTIENHLGSILRKLGARNRLQAVVKGLELGILEIKKMRKEISKMVGARIAFSFETSELDIVGTLLDYSASEHGLWIQVKPDWEGSPVSWFNLSRATALTELED